MNLKQHKRDGTRRPPHGILPTAFFQPFSCYDIVFRERKTRRQRETLIIAFTSGRSFHDRGDRLEDISFFMALFDTNKTNLLFSLLEELEWVACGLLLFFPLLRKFDLLFARVICYHNIQLFRSKLVNLLVAVFAFLYLPFTGSYTVFTAYFATLLCSFRMRRSISGCGLYDFLTHDFMTRCEVYCRHSQVNKYENVEQTLNGMNH